MAKRHIRLRCVRGKSPSSRCSLPKSPKFVYFPYFLYFSPISASSPVPSSPASAYFLSLSIVVACPSVYRTRKRSLRVQPILPIPPNKPARKRPQISARQPLPFFSALYNTNSIAPDIFGFKAEYGTFCTSLFLLPIPPRSAG